MKARASLVAVALPALLSVPAIVGCHKSPPPAPAAPAVDPPVPAPEGRLADVTVTTPNASWTRAQKGIGGALGILPATFGGLTCSLAGLDLGLAPEIDGTAPAFAVLAKDGDGAVGWALAVKLLDPRHVLGLLAEGDTAHFTPKVSGPITVLAPKPPLTSMSSVTIGVARGGFLLVARNEADLGRLGPYAYRTLPARPLPPSAVSLDVPHEALAGTLHDDLSSAWSAFRDDARQKDAAQRAEHGGRAPDFGDAPAILGSADAAVQRYLALLTDLTAAHLAVDLKEDAVDATLTADPAPGGGPTSQAIAAAQTGDVAPLRALPAGTGAGLLTRSRAATRTEDGALLEAGLAGALGRRLRPADTQKLHAMIDDWESGRGDWLTLAASFESPEALFLHTPAADPAKAARAVREAVDLLQAPAFREPLKTFLALRTAPVSSEQATELGPATVAVWTRESPDGKGGVARSHVGLAWGVFSGDLYAAAAEDPTAALAPMVDAATPSGATKRGKTLGDDPELDSALASLGDRTSFALVAQPEVQAAAGSQRAPFVLGWGKDGDHGWAHLHLGNALARDLLRRQIGL